MKPPAIRLALCAALFVLWLGYLGYQVAMRPVVDGRPLVLSRPQILASKWVVVAELPAPNSDEFVTADVVEVLHGEGIKEGEKIRVRNPGECRPLYRGAAPPDWSGAGRYLLPLSADEQEKGAYQVTPVPASPGFETLNAGRIYPRTDESLAQYRRIEK